MKTKIQRTHVSDRTVGDYIQERDARDPGFAARVDALGQQFELGRKVRELREQRGLTQAQLAERAATAQASIARIESGKAVPKLDLLARIAAALGARLSVELTTGK